MLTHATPTPEIQPRIATFESSEKQTRSESTGSFVDNRPEAITQRKIQGLANQHVFQQPIQRKENKTGLPDELKSGIENLSSYSMDDVKVHYNSAKPKELDAHAYAQGTDIHVASGQEEHLAHEAWHVVQQKQGRVKPTLQLKGRVAVNDDNGLENEADRMGEKALQMKSYDASSGEEALQTAADPAPVVQRFTILNQGQYQTAGAHQDQMFPSNQLTRGRTTTTDGEGVDSITNHLKWEPRHKDGPPLKVSEHGLLALESTVGQPKVFYGEANRVAASRQRLINIKSRITLDIEPGQTLTVPKNPGNPNGQTNDLARVKPVHSPHIDPAEDLMDADVCTNVSERIVGGKILSIGNSIDGEKLVNKVTVSNVSGLGKTLNTMQDDSTLEDFAQERKKNDGPPIARDPNLPITQEVREFFSNGAFKRTHLIPGDQVLRALSMDGIPEKLWDQVYELYVGKTENQRPDELGILDHINGYLQLQETLKYHQTKRNQGRVHQFGINERTAPEVGESFSTFYQPGPGTLDEYGVKGHGVDLSDMSGKDTNKLVERFLRVKTSADQLGMLALSQYQKAKGLVQFGEHHAAVVAKDAMDTVTFENYNRGAESDTLQEELWAGWFKRKDEFDKSITDELRLLLKNIRTEQDSDLHNVTMKSFWVTKRKREALEQFKDDFVELTATTRAKLDTNIIDQQNNLWHFNMYGPANRTYTDEKGKQRGQSFHDTWSGSVPNAITVRTTALVDDTMKNTFRQKSATLAFQIIKAAGFLDPSSVYLDLKDQLLRSMNPSQKRIDLSDILVRLDARLAQYPALTLAEQQEAEVLLKGRKQEIFGQLLINNLHGEQGTPKGLFFKQFYRDVFGG